MNYEDVDEKNELYNLYIIQNLSAQKIAALKNTTKYIITHRLQKYGIKKGAKKAGEQFKKEIPASNLYKYYIEQNHSTEETAHFFGVHERTIRRRIKEYGFTKSLEAQKICSYNSQIKKYGALFPQSEYYKKYIIQDMIKKMQETCLKKYGVVSFSQTDEGIRNKKSRYLYNQIFFDSSWEVALYIYAIDHGEEIMREPLKIPYEYNGREHFYIPDFLYKGQLIDIKGNHLVREGKLASVFKSSQEKDYYKQKCIVENNVKIYLFEDIKFAIDYVNDKYGKNFLHELKIKNNK